MNILNRIENFFVRLYDRFYSTTTSAALADLEKAQVRLEKAIAYHDSQALGHDYAIEQHRAHSDAHTYAAIRAERVQTKLADLLG